MAKMKVTIEVEQTGPEKWSAWDPVTGDIETRPTKWQAIQAVVNKRAHDEATTAAVKVQVLGTKD